jgi:hypothetical protein
LRSRKRRNRPRLFIFSSLELSKLCISGCLKSSIFSVIEYGFAGSGVFNNREPTVAAGVP